MKLVNITNHQLTKEQIEGAHVELGVTEIVELPEEYKKMWGNINPLFNETEILDYIKPIRQWAIEQDYKYAIVAGDFSATIAVIGYLTMAGVICLQSTTMRETIELPDGKKISKFSHIQYRNLSTIFRNYV